MDTEFEKTKNKQQERKREESSVKAWGGGGEGGCARKASKTQPSQGCERQNAGTENRNGRGQISVKSCKGLGDKLCGRTMTRGKERSEERGPLGGRLKGKCRQAKAREYEGHAWAGKKGQDGCVDYEKNGIQLCLPEQSKVKKEGEEWTKLKDKAYRPPQKQGLKKTGRGGILS